MNPRTCFPAVLLVCAAAAWPAERISADQLENLVASACSNGTPDAQVALSLSHVELTERLPFGRLDSLLALPIGPRTRDVLQIVADVSAFLDQPPDHTPPPEAPSAAQQQEMLTRVREYTLRYIRALPDFVAFRMTRRFDDSSTPNGRPEVWRNLVFRDSNAGQLSYNNGKESYVDNATAHAGPGIVSERQGLSSFGEFGSIIGALFSSDSHIQLTWGYWEPMIDRRLAVFHYSIPAGHSHYTVSYCCDQRVGGVSVTVAYRGDLFVDPETGAVWRVTRDALDLPPDFPTHWAKTIVDYRPVPITQAWYMLPVRSMTYSESTSIPVRYWNDVRFVHYQRFEAEAHLTTGEATQAPAEDERLPQKAPEPWLEVDRAAKDSPPEQTVQTSPASRTGIPTIRASVQLVEVPIIVRDRRGESVPGLKQGDFEVYDNDVRQEVRVFREEGSELKTVATNVPAVSRNQVFSNAEPHPRIPDDSTFILIDTHGMDWAERAFVRIEILRFLRDLPEAARSRRYLVVGTNFIPLQETRQIQNRLADDRDFAVNPFGFPPSGEAAKWTCSMSLSAAEFYLKALAGLAEHLAAIPGRKNVIWATASFPLVAAKDTCAYLMPPLLRILNNANVAVYPIEAPGLKTAFADATTMAPIYNPFWAMGVSQTHAMPIYANESTMLELSDGTGGRAFLNANRVDSDLRTALEDTRGFYWLGFYPNSRNDGQYHHIVVKIAGRTDLHPRYREGYFDNAAPAENNSVLQSALEDTTDDAGIPLTAELEHHGGKCEMKLKIGLAPVMLQQERKRYTGKLEILVAERSDAPAASGSLKKLEQTLGLQLKPETYEQAMRDGFPYRYSFTPKSTVTSLRVAVQDPGAGAVGSLTVPVAGCGNELTAKSSETESKELARALDIPPPAPAAPAVELPKAPPALAAPSTPAPSAKNDEIVTTEQPATFKAQTSLVAELMRKSREKALSYIQSLPDFVATEFIRRYVGPPRAGFYRLDTLTIQLRYFQHMEEHKLIQHNAEPSRAALEDLHGLVGSGEFGAAISAIFNPDSQTSFHFQKWITVRRRPAARFAFEVDVAHSRYTLGAAKLVVGYDGILEIDGETGEVLHLEYVADHIPKQLGFSHAAATVDYSLTDINGRKYLLPSRSSMELHGPDQWQRNVIDFRDYRKFSADSTIDFAK